MSDVGQHLLSGITHIQCHEYVSHLPQAPFPDSRPPSSCNPVRPSLLARRPSSRRVTSGPHKDASSAGRCPTQDKVSLSRPHENHAELPICPVKPVPFAPPHG